MAKKSTSKKPKDLAPRFGIGEWFGFNISELTPERRRYYAEQCLLPKKSRDPQPCPFQRKKGAICSKNGGVCSLRLFKHEIHPASGRAMGVVATGPKGEFRSTCPYRFHELLEVFNWVGEKIINDSNPRLVGEVGFLEAGPSTDSLGGEDVGKIDMVIVSTKSISGVAPEWAPSVPTTVRQTPAGSLALRAEVETSHGYARFDRHHDPCRLWR